jgi:N-acylneuraminate cytidylyltransferase
MLNDITAIIPVRRENGRLPNKNILPFGDSNLLIHKIRQLKLVTKVNKIIVSSECDEMLEMARREGVIPLKRPIEYASRKTSFGKYVNYICKEVEGTHVLWAPVTSPLVETSLYEEAISLYFEKLNEGYDSLITVQPHKRFLIDSNGSLNFRRGLQHKNSEDLPELFIFTNGIVMAPRLSMIEWNYNWGYMPYRMEVDKKAGIDISDIYDYEFAKFLLKAKL